MARPGFGTSGAPGNSAPFNFATRDKGLVGHKENQLRRRLQKTPDALHGEIIEAARTARRGGGPPALPGDLAPVPLGRLRRETAAFDPTQS